MKIKNRIYLNREISKNQLIEFDSRHSHYLSTVLRSKIGDNVSVFNESVEYVVELSSVHRKKVRGTAIERIKTLRLNNPLTLYFSPIKKVPTEIIIQKCTEIGVTNFQPIIMERTQFKTFNIDRLKLIAIEAIEQSNQTLIPQINVPIHFEDFIKRNSANILACCLIEEANNMSQIFDKNKIDIKGILIGPEGDFSDKEINAIRHNKFIIPITLGNNVLKSETACIVASSLIKEYS
ncbi:MAG: hypothetical protein CMI87_04135 [Pelagibacteraceae bacterium]|jgi:16S rRNA (uracil1498-N3)-methyltransferase|nr:hypothetical protein [Pelagibacteraceae bacterium]|tara:strand:- start:17738 stop:18445 length:708 start_codon:yes stop_codon:yes gene_type:complete